MASRAPPNESRPPLKSATLSTARSPSRLLSGPSDRSWINSSCHSSPLRNPRRRARTCTASVHASGLMTCTRRASVRDQDAGLFKRRSAVSAAKAILTRSIDGPATGPKPVRKGSIVARREALSPPFAGQQITSASPVPRLSSVKSSKRPFIASLPGVWILRPSSALLLRAGIRVTSQALRERGSLPSQASRQSIPGSWPPCGRQTLNLSPPP